MSEAEALRDVFEREKERLLRQEAGREPLVTPHPDAPGDAIGNWYSASMFPPDWTEQLLTEGLARRRGDSEILVDRRLRRMMFAVAADHLVRQRADQHARGPRRFTYTLDQGFFWVVNAPVNDAAEHPCLEVELGDLLPIPAPGTDLKKLIEFREKHNDERERLMAAVLALQDELAERHDGHVYELTQHLRIELRDAIQDLNKAAKATKWTWLRGGACVMFAVSAAAAVATLPGTAQISVPLAYQALA